MNTDNPTDSHQHTHLAIMFTDLEGSTLLMEKDEQKGLETIRRNQEIHESCLNQNNGKLLKEIGDGYLVTFKEVNDAVHCAMDIQQRAREEMRLSSG